MLFFVLVHTLKGKGLPVDVLEFLFSIVMMNIIFDILLKLKTFISFSEDTKIYLLIASIDVIGSLNKVL